MSYIKNRPKAPKSYNDNYTSDNSYTRSTIKVEYKSGDCTKVIGEMCHQLSEYDGFQKEDVLALINSYWDNHIIEKDIE